MGSLKAFYTIPELYKFLTEDFGPKKGGHAIFRKVDNVYTGITYPELKKETDSFAFGLNALGLKKGDSVALISENRPEWVYADFAMQMLGIVNVPLYPSLTSDSIEYILNDSESKAIIVSTGFQLNKVQKVLKNCKHLKYIIILNDHDDVSVLDNLFTFAQIQEKGKNIRNSSPDLLKKSSAEIKEDDICTIIYTSGTTGEPKGVILTHQNIISNVNAALEIFPITKDDVFLSFLPLCHIFERMAGCYTAFAAGCTIYYAESIEKVAANLQEAKPTLMTSVPRLFERIQSRIIKNVESQSVTKQKIFYWALDLGKQYFAAKKKGSVPFALSTKYKVADKLVFKKIRERTGGRLRFFISGGAALSKELGEFFEAAGIKIVEGYGLTESSPVITANKPDDYKFGTVGKPLPGVEVKIAPDGEILARGPNIMKGYYKKKKETDETIINGWLHTGDIGVFDTEGFLQITDRKKHLFKTSAGKYIAPTPIENIFLASKYIDQFVLIGDKRMFLSALIVPDYEALKEYADAHKISYNNEGDLTNNDQIYKLIEDDMGKLQKKLANYERVRKFALLDKPFTIETGEITPSLKIKRKVVEEKYNYLIEKMYFGGMEKG
ncbi:MAG: long-chain fatty acid--CoA ligase [Ignavibacteriota bacterium]|nr:MAG: long-chain fatty acid--CoA ligase [Chlorobiota bacterium]MBE7477461.1 long-chain fatty acid--CoA ligase [Ignavibacteriales bacterium]MBL1122862.1 long-chain fatty acid--CoA ligase [Ignavibacteriota bacterium]MBV6421489.1 Long-chain-fatty-acid--CoA ligase FadD15 [Ignavibacteriaceae bacterium]MCE7856464.1 long-chain fatty acid--CoA ligase [Ignavibacteria bacterium CHB3]